jgi:hypothetical protein
MNIPKILPNSSTCFRDPTSDIYIYIYILDTHMAPDGACEVVQSEFEAVQ